MKASELNDWLGVVTNIGVILGLALVAYELSLTRRAVDLSVSEWRGAIAFDTNEMFSQVPLLLAEDGTMAKIWLKGAEGEGLTDVVRANQK